VKRVVLAFHGHFERDDSFSYAMGDDVPVFVHGMDDDDALESFKQGLLLYVGWLAEQGQLDRVVKTGSAHVKLSAALRSRPLARVERDADRFEVELAGTR
jgi:hypothetical protein